MANNFQIFDSAAANMTSDADYTSSDARQNGFIAGQASHALFNKAFRQCSIIAYAIGQFISNLGGSASDAGSTGLIASLTAAITLANHRINSLYFSVENVDPGTIFGGTWVAWGAGRTPVGVNVLDSNFNTVEKTGGTETNVHRSASLFAELQLSATTLAINPKSSVSYTSHAKADSFSGESDNTARTQGVVVDGYTDVQSNLPPYETCYIFKRTA